MTKAIEATCGAGVVKVGTVPLTEAKKLSKGIGQSTGVVFLDEKDQYYVANTTPDLEQTLTDVVSLLDQVKTALNAVKASLDNLKTYPFIVGAAPAASPVPWVTTAFELTITQVNTAISGFDPIKAELNTLKGNLK